MKIQLLYQKVYFKSSEWKELVNNIRSFDSSISLFLLSKNTYLSELKEIKSKFLGECVIVEFFFNDINMLFDLVSKIQSKCSSKFFLVGFLFNSDSKVYFLKVEQIKHYLSYYSDRKKNLGRLNTLHSLFLYEFLKFLKLNEVNKSLCLSFFKNNVLDTNFNYYI
jgi:hypothetical protein